MSSSHTPVPPSPAPPPSLILEALRAVLLPAPILSQLPTALQLFAHVQLLSRRVHEACVTVLRLQRRLIRQLSEKGLSDLELVEQGALSEREGDEVRQIKDGHPSRAHEGQGKEEQDDKMLAFSLEFRKYHIAKLLSTPKLPLAQALRIIDNYFPDISTTSVTNHPTLFIRSMKADQVIIYDMYRDEVRKWYARAQQRKENDQPVLNFIDLYPKERDNGALKVQSLVHNLIKETERVVDDIATLEAVFVRTNPGSREISVDLNHSPAGKGKAREAFKDESVNRRHTIPAAYPTRLVTLTPSPDAGPSRPDRQGDSYSLNTTYEPDRSHEASRGGSLYAQRKQQHGGRASDVFDITGVDSDPQPGERHASPVIDRPPARANIGNVNSNRRQTLPATIPSSFRSLLPKPSTLDRGKARQVPFIPSSDIEIRASPGRPTRPEVTPPTLTPSTQTPTSTSKKRKARQSFPPTGPEYMTSTKYGSGGGAGAVGASREVDGTRKQGLKPFESSQLGRGVKKQRMSVELGV